MVAVFLHGVPDDGHLWDDVRALLPEVPSHAPNLPGFHEPLPPGFTATKEEYADWLADTVADLGEPVDLVGHGWGAILAMRLVSVRPGAVRTIAVGGCAPEERWGEMARTWQTPGVGEQLMADMEPDAYVPILVEAGMPREAAERCVFDDPVAKDCILRLYRSAVQMSADWGPGLRPLRVPAAVLWGEQDIFAPPTVGARLAQRVGASLQVFAGCSHWFPYHRAKETAAQLRRLWGG